MIRISFNDDWKKKISIHPNNCDDDLLWRDIRKLLDEGFILKITKE
jgi:hypothetical protein